MALGFTGYNSVCYSSIHSAGASYVQNEPTSTVVNGVTCSLKVQQWVGYGTNTLNVNVDRTCGTTVTTQSKTYQYPSCTATTPVDITSSTFVSPSTIDTSYNYQSAGAVWAFAFTTVFAFWYFAKNIGSLINAIKNF